METRMKPGDVVRHFKGNRYQILYFAKDSETQEDVVVYRALYGERGVWVRPMGMFFSLVDKVKYPALYSSWTLRLSAFFTKQTTALPFSR